jgi:hypothetical protein
LKKFLFLVTAAILNGGQSEQKVTALDKVCIAFSPGTLVSSTNKTDRHDIAEILLKVALNIINQAKSFSNNSKKISGNEYSDILLTIYLIDMYIA